MTNAEPQPTLVYGPPIAPEPRPRRRAPIIVLSILTVLGLAGTATFGALYFTEKQEHERVAIELTAKDKSLADASKQAQDSKAQAQDATSRMQQAQGAKDEAEAKAGGYARCHDSARALLDVAIAQDESKIQKALNDLFTNCH